MNKKFDEWAKNKENILENFGISCDIPDFTKDNIEKGLSNPCQTVYFDSKVYFGKVSVWKDGQMDTEILNSDTEEIIDYKYYQSISDANFDILLEEFFRKILNGTGV